MSRQALGRGINALLGQETTNKISEEYIEIDLDLIEPNTEQPRKNFKEENLQELAQSIIANGIVQPIIVRRRGGLYQIIAGERRWRASQKAGLKKIPAIIKEIKDEKLLELALIENIQREDLNAIEEAKAYKNLINSIGLTQEMVAERVGKSRTLITTCLRLLKLPKDIQKLVEEEKLSPGHGRALLMTENIEIQRKLAQKVVEMSLSVRETEKAVKRAKSEFTKETDKIKSIQKIDPNITIAETKLKRKLSTQIHIIPDGRGTGGKIEIEYYSDSDLDRIYELIIEGKESK